jgi:hypothetical protein
MVCVAVRQARAQFQFHSFYISGVRQTRTVSCMLMCEMAHFGKYCLSILDHQKKNT